MHLNSPQRQQLTEECENNRRNQSSPLPKIEEGVQRSPMGGQTSTDTKFYIDFHLSQQTTERREHAKTPKGVNTLFWDGDYKRLTKLYWTNPKQACIVRERCANGMEL